MTAEITSVSSHTCRNSGTDAEFPGVQKFDVCPQDQFLMSSRRRRSRSASGTNPEIPDRHVRLRIRLDFLNRATLLEDVNLPGWKLHSLKGQRKGEYAITVTGNYRLTFRFENGEAHEVNLEDYH